MELVSSGFISPSSSLLDLVLSLRLGLMTFLWLGASSIILSTSSLAGNDDLSENPRG